MISELWVPISQRNLLLFIQSDDSVIPLTPLSLRVLPLIISDPDTGERTRNDLRAYVDVMTTMEVRFVFLEIRPSRDDSTGAA